MSNEQTPNADEGRRSTAQLGQLPDRSYLGDDVSYGYDECDMREYATEAVRKAVAAERDCRTCRNFRDGITHAAHCVSVLRCVAGSSYQRGGVVQIWEEASVSPAPF